MNVLYKLRNLFGDIAKRRIVQRFKIGDKVWYHDIKEGAWDKGEIAFKRVGNTYDVRLADGHRRLINGRNLRAR